MWVNLPNSAWVSPPRAQQEGDTPNPVMCLKFSFLLSMVCTGKFEEQEAQNGVVK